MSYEADLEALVRETELLKAKGNALQELKTQREAHRADAQTRELELQREQEKLSELRKQVTQAQQAVDDIRGKVSAKNVEVAQLDEQIEESERALQQNPVLKSVRVAQTENDSASPSATTRESPHAPLAAPTAEVSSNEVAQHTITPPAAVGDAGLENNFVCDRQTGVWIALRCSLCGANANKAEDRFFKRETGLISHLKFKHSSKKPEHGYAELFHKQEFSAEQIEDFRKGKAVYEKNYGDSTKWDHNSSTRLSLDRRHAESPAGLRQDPKVDQPESSRDEEALPKQVSPPQPTMASKEVVNERQSIDVQIDEEEADIVVPRRRASTLQMFSGSQKVATDATILETPDPQTLSRSQRDNEAATKKRKRDDQNSAGASRDPRLRSVACNEQRELFVNKMTPGGVTPLTCDRADVEHAINEALRQVTVNDSSPALAAIHQEQLYYRCVFKNKQDAASLSGTTLRLPHGQNRILTPDRQGAKLFTIEHSVGKNCSLEAIVSEVVKYYSGRRFVMYQRCSSDKMEDGYWLEFDEAVMPSRDITIRQKRFRPQPWRAQVRIAQTAPCKDCGETHAFTVCPFSLPHKISHPLLDGMRAQED